MRLSARPPAARAAAAARSSSTAARVARRPAAGQAALDKPADDGEWDYEAPTHVRQRNTQFWGEQLAGRVLLAPLTKGGNLPFRRLCATFDPQLATVSEMAFARQLLKGNRVERARLYKHESERCFGVQIATNSIAEGVAAAQLAHEAGAAFLDLNCGCPIYEATKRGLGAALLRKPTKLAKLVAGIAAGSPLPVTVKIRSGESSKKINAHRLVPLLHQAGAAAVTVHARTMEQRYKKASDWGLVAELVAANRGLPLIGNGDVLAHYEAAARQQASGCAALMVGRGALIKPWIFAELAAGRELQMDAAARVGVYRQLASFFKEHFRDDAIGRRRAWYVWPWLFGWFCRWRPLPAHVYEAASLQHPLLCTRPPGIADPLAGEDEDSLPLAERLLRCESEAAHAAIAAVLWDSASDAEALSQLEALAHRELPAWEREVRERNRSGSDSDDALAEG